MVGDEELVEGIEKGTKVRVKTPVTVYHSPKLGDFDLEGKEGEVMEVGPSCSNHWQCLCPYQVDSLLSQIFTQLLSRTLTSTSCTTVGLL